MSRLNRSRKAGGTTATAGGSKFRAVGMSSVFGMSSDASVRDSKTNRNGGTGEYADEVILIDEFGRNITPRPLRPSASQTAKGNIAPANLQSGNLGQSSRSILSDSSASSVIGAAEGIEAIAAAGFDSMEEYEETDEWNEAAQAGLTNENDFSRFPAQEVAPVKKTYQPPKQLNLTDLELSELCSSYLSESPTVMLFQKKSNCALSDSKEGQKVKEDNERYKKMLQSHSRFGVELYTSRGTNTLPVPTKVGSTQTQSIPRRSQQTQSTIWDIIDSTKSGGDASTPNNAAAGAASSQRTDPSVGESTGDPESFIESLVVASLSTPGALLDVEAQVDVLATPDTVYNSALELLRPNEITGSHRTGGRSSSNVSRTGTSFTGLNGSFAGDVGRSNAQSRNAWGVGTSTGSVSDLQSQVGGGATEAAAAVTPQGEAGGEGQLDPILALRRDKILSLPTFSAILATTERAVLQNLYHDSQKKYRALPSQDLLDKLITEGRSSSGISGVGHVRAAKLMKAAGSLRGTVLLGMDEEKAGDYAGYEYSNEEAERKDAEIHGRTGSDTELDQTSKQEPSLDESTGVAETGESDRNKDQGAHDSDVLDHGGKSDEDNVEGRDEMEDNTRKETVEGPGTATSEYTDLQETGSLFSSEAPALVHLWTYNCDRVKGYTVTSMAWNTLDKDILAVGYGQRGIAVGKESRGLVALWTLANVLHPLVVLTTSNDAGVCSLDFSPVRPNLLAAGLSDGTVCIWDIQRAIKRGGVCPPYLSSDKLSTGSHTSASWAVLWRVVPQDPEGHTLLSTSSDGRVIEWSIRKGLLPSTILTLKRPRGTNEQSGTSATSNSPGTAPTGEASGSGEASNMPPALGAEGSEGILSRLSPGLALAMSNDPQDTSGQYFVGLDGGYLVRCNTSYTEQYIEVVQAHANAITQIRPSPFFPQAGLLTTSEDWTIRLWNAMNSLCQPPLTSASQTETAAGNDMGGRCLTFSSQNVKDGIADACWSQTIPTRFAAVSNDGFIQIWDVTQIERPLLEEGVRRERHEWIAELEAENARMEALVAERLEQEVIRIRTERDDDENLPIEPELLVMLESNIREELNWPKKGGKGDEEEYDITENKLPPRKQLTCVLFAATNTHILLTGDSTGKVDVYRLVGLPHAYEAGQDVSTSSPADEEANAQAQVDGDDETEPTGFEKQLNALIDVLESF